jgi:hypothetical protein
LAFRHGEHALDLGEGLGQAVHADHDRGAVVAGHEPQLQLAVVEERVGDLPAACPELGNAVLGLLGAAMVTTLISCIAVS